MEQPLNAHKAGTVTGLTAEVGATVSSGAVHLRDQGLTRPAGARRQPRHHLLDPQVLVPPLRDGDLVASRVLVAHEPRPGRYDARPLAS